MAIKFFETSNLSDIAGAIPTAIQGYQDSKARQREEQEFKAKLAANKNAERRQMAMDIAKLKSENIQISPGDDVYEKVISGDYTQAPQKMKFGDKLNNLQKLASLEDKGFDTGYLQQEMAQESGLMGQRRGLMKQGLLRKTPEAQQEAALKRQELRSKLQKTKMAPSSALRKEWVKDDTTKRTKQVAESFNRIKQSATNPSAAGDLSLVFNYMKMLDPGSVVRESEFRTAADARAAISKLEGANVAVPAFLKQGVQKLQTGQFLLPEQRQDFAGQASNLFNAQMAAQNEVNRQYQKLSQDYGVDPKLVVREELFVPMETNQRVKGMKVLEGLPGSGKEVDMLEERELDKLNQELDKMLQGMQ